MSEIRENKNFSESFGLKINDLILFAINLEKDPSELNISDCMDIFMDYSEDKLSSIFEFSNRITERREQVLSFLKKLDIECDIDTLFDSIDTIGQLARDINSFLKKNHRKLEGEDEENLEQDRKDLERIKFRFVNNFKFFEKDLESDMSSLENEKNIDERYIKAQKLEEKLSSILYKSGIKIIVKGGGDWLAEFKGNLSGEISESEVDIDLKKLFRTSIYDSSPPNFSESKGWHLNGKLLRVLVDCIYLTYLRKNFEDLLKSWNLEFDFDQLEEDRRNYGGKSSYYKALAEIFDKIYKQEAVEEHSFTRNLKILPSEYIGVKVYESWKNGEDIKPFLKEFFENRYSLKEVFDERFKRDKFDEILSDDEDEQENITEIILRSSAVFSEDSEEFSGAGIYESVSISLDSSFEEFVKAIEEIFKSVDSDRAQKYRAENGIEKDESMGILIQPKIQVELNEKEQDKGYINTQKPGVPKLAEVISEKGLSFYFNRFWLDFSVGFSGFYPRVNHLLHDHNKKPNNKEKDLSELIFLMNHLFKNKITQIEYLIKGGKIFILQNRPLPKKLENEQASFEFPEKDSIHEGLSIGMIDKELEVLGQNYSNSDKKGIVFLESSHANTINQFEDFFPKSGVVVLTGNMRGEHGHLETICAERGLVCIFQNIYKSSGWSNLHIYETRALEGKKLRVVSNGFEGKIYK